MHNTNQPYHLKIHFKNINYMYIQVQPSSHENVKTVKKIGESQLKLNGLIRHSIMF